MSDIYQPSPGNLTNVQKIFLGDVACTISGVIPVDLEEWSEPDYSGRFQPYCPCS